MVWPSLLLWLVYYLSVRPCLSPSLMDAATEDTSGVFVPSYESANVAASAGTDG